MSDLDVEDARRDEDGSDKDGGKNDGSDEEWQRKDVWLGVLFLVAGVLIGLLAWTFFLNEWPKRYAFAATGISALFLFLGGNACVQSLLSRRR